MKRKVFVYVTLKEDGINYLLAFESLDEPGFEVPKGSVEPDEGLMEAVHREVLEESGVTHLDIIKELGITTWQDEQQHFFLARTLTAKREEYEHQVTGNDFDDGFRYRFKWLAINSSLEKCLVQGCDRFVRDLIVAVSED